MVIVRLIHLNLQLLLFFNAFVCLQNVCYEYDRIRPNIAGIASATLFDLKHIFKNIFLLIHLPHVNWCHMFDSRRRVLY